MLSLLYHELMRKIKEYEGQKYLMVDGYIPHEVLDRMKGILGIEDYLRCKTIFCHKVTLGV